VTLPSVITTPNLSPSPTALPLLLAAHIAAVSSILTGASDPVWKLRPAATEWSLTEIMCHLRDVDQEVNLPRMHSVVEAEDPFISAADTDPWAIERDYQSQSGPEALKDFMRAREALSGFLSGRPEAVWRRTARHAIFGPTHLAEMVGWILDHDRMHLEQLRVTRQKVEAVYTATSNSK
jgi:hypothetical protein